MTTNIFYMLMRIDPAIILEAAATEFLEFDPLPADPLDQPPCFIGVFQAQPDLHALVAITPSPE